MSCTASLISEIWGSEQELKVLLCLHQHEENQLTFSLLCSLTRLGFCRPGVVWALPSLSSVLVGVGCWWSP